jgi:serine/threonine protein kinase
VIKSVARGDDENTLCHTLYRFIVLFGLPDRNPSESKGIDKVWQLLLKHLRPEDPANNHPQRRSRRTAGTKGTMQQAKTAKDQFELDQSLFSLAIGSNDTIRRCREEFERMAGAMDLVKKLVDFDPSKRPTLKQVMYHPLFSSLRSASKNKERPADYVISYYASRSQRARLIPDV